jgi:hypothetical protein
MTEIVMPPSVARTTESGERVRTSTVENCTEGHATSQQEGNDLFTVAGVCPTSHEWFGDCCYCGRVRAVAAVRILGSVSDSNIHMLTICAKCFQYMDGGVL